MPSLAASLQRHETVLISRLDQLESPAERDEFRTKVDHLRDYESRFRETFLTSMQRQIDAVRSAQIAPDDLPELLRDDARGASATPRLDALLAREG